MRDTPERVGKMSLVLLCPNSIRQIDCLPSSFVVPTFVSIEKCSLTTSLQVRALDLFSTLASKPLSTRAFAFVLVKWHLFHLLDVFHLPNGTL